jgi:hypothetical protein
MKKKLISVSILCLTLLLCMIAVSCNEQEVAPEKSVTLKAGNVTYTLVKVANPNADQRDAYTRITNAMNAAVAMYNGQANLTRHVTVHYVPSVPTADGNINGTIRFGSNRTYMTQCTAMHEIGHTMGVGTSARYRQLVVNGIFTGANATRMLRSMVGESPTAVLHADGHSFWPYGLNYNSEWSTVNGQRHARIVGAMKVDGI